MAGEKDQDFFGMSDDDFAKMGPSSLGSSDEASASSSASEEEENAGNVSGDANGQDGSDAAAADGNASDDDPAATGTGDEASTSNADASQDKTPDELSDEELAKAGAPATEKQSKDGKPADASDDGKGKAKTTPEAEPVKTDGTKEKDTPAVIQSSKDLSQEQLAQFYDNLIGKPIRANGKDIVLKTPHDVERMVQMGAGYGRKLQEIQPHLKTLRMLEKNDLLSDEKLSYLIDLDKKNPDAIKKLIKESGIDPLDLNIEDNASYRPTNHSVSDTEVAFSEALKEVSALPGGRKTIQHINEDWDPASKEALWAQPEILSHIQTARENGVYDQITTEIDRLKLLGEIKPNIPFLEAYKIAGDALVNSNSLILPGSEQSPKPAQAAPSTPAQGANGQQPGRVLGTRDAAPKSGAANNDKARAASSPQSSTRKAKTTINPLEMADDDFLKTFKL